MKLSARNKLKGKIVEVKKGVTTSHALVAETGRIKSQRSFPYL